jgi:excisionase family DNA binding protein
MQADDLVIGMPITAAFIDAVARRVAEILAEDGSRASGEYLTVREAAGRLGVHENTIRGAIKDGRLAAGRVGTRGAWRIEADALHRLISVSPATYVARGVRVAAKRKRPAAPTPSFSARARARLQVEPRPQPPSTKEVT